MRKETAAMLMLAWTSPMAAELIAFTPPARLEGPSRTDSALGTTWRWHGKQPAAMRRIEISVVSLPDEVANTRIASPTMCVAMFAGELRKHSTDFYLEPVPDALRAGPLELTQMRWTRTDEDSFSTGVTACALYKQRFVAVNFGSNAVDAVDFLTAVRSQLPGLKLLF